MTMSERASRTFVYVLPSLGEDLVKVGLTHDPLERFRSLHPRFYNHFDLERGLLIETPQLRQARRVERLFIERWSDHRASAPTVVNETAGGHTEWFRGIDMQVSVFASRIAERYGYALHAPLRVWLRQKLAERSDALYQWSSAIFDQLQQQAFLESNMPGHERAATLRHMLDMYTAMELPVETLVPDAVYNWYRRDGALRMGGN
jgi:hypothetical protein